MTGEPRATYIAPPAATGSERLPYIRSFNEAAENSAPKLVDRIEDPALFGRPLTPDNQALDDTLALKMPGTGFYIPPQYEQFVPELRKMIDYYYKNYGDDGVCMMTVRQRIVQPDEKETGAFVQAHKDLSPERIVDGRGAPNPCIMLASDTLPTGFSDYRLTDADFETIRRSGQPDVAFREIIDRAPHTYTTFPEGSITAHRAETVHALANPDVPTFRTMILVVFRPEGEMPPLELTNPYLEKAIKDRAVTPAAAPRAAP